MLGSYGYGLETIVWSSIAGDKSPIPVPSVLWKFGLKRMTVEMGKKEMFNFFGREKANWLFSQVLGYDSN